MPDVSPESGASKDPRDIVAELVLGAKGSFDAAIEAGPAIVPWLERMIRNGAEIGQQGGRIDRVLRAYAKILGPEAVPLLESSVTDPERENHYGVGGRFAFDCLHLIDDPVAIEAILRLVDQHDLRPYCEFLARTSVGRDVLRHWETDPIPRVQPLPESIREALFRNGAPGDRERLWRERSTKRIRHLLSILNSRHTSWGAPWTRRYREALIEAVRGEDPQLQQVALEMALRHPETFSAEENEEIERAAAEFRGPEAHRVAEELRRRQKERRLREILES